MRAPDTCPLGPCPLPAGGHDPQDSGALRPLLAPQHAALLRDQALCLHCQPVAGVALWGQGPDGRPGGGAGNCRGVSSSERCLERIGPGVANSETSNCPGLQSKARKGTPARPAHPAGAAPYLLNVCGQVAGIQARPGSAAGNGALPAALVLAFHFVTTPGCNGHSLPAAREAVRHAAMPKDGTHAACMGPVNQSFAHISV